MNLPSKSRKRRDIQKCDIQILCKRMCSYFNTSTIQLWWCILVLFCPLSGSLSLPFRLQQLTGLFTSSVRSVLPYSSPVIGADGTMGIGPPSSNHPWEWLDNENRDGRELLLSSLIANGTTTTTSSPTSAVRYLSSHTRNRQHTYANDKYMYSDNFDSDDTSMLRGSSGSSRFFSPEALQRWWTRHTAGHRGLLIFLIPSLLRSVTTSSSMSHHRRHIHMLSVISSFLCSCVFVQLIVQPSVGAAGGGAVLSGPSVAVPLAHVHRRLFAVAAESGSCAGADGVVCEHMRWRLLHAR